MYGPPAVPPNLAARASALRFVIREEANHEPESPEEKEDGRRALELVQFFVCRKEECEGDQNANRKTDEDKQLDSSF